MRRYRSSLAQGRMPKSGSICTPPTSTPPARHAAGVFCSEHGALQLRIRRQRSVPRSRLINLGTDRAAAW